MNPGNGCTVLHKALLGRKERLARELILSGADVKARDLRRTTPLHVASMHGLDRIVSTLLLRGAEKDAVDIDGDSALIYASGVYGPHPAVVETLLGAGVDLNIRGRDSYSALDWASHVGDVPTVQAILRRGADVNSCNAHGLSALHRATFCDQADAINALVEAGADIEKAGAG